MIISIPPSVKTYTTALVVLAVERSRNQNAYTTRVCYLLLRVVSGLGDFSTVGRHANVRDVAVDVQSTFVANPANRSATGGLAECVVRAVR